MGGNTAGDSGGNVYVQPGSGSSSGATYILSGAGVTLSEFSASTIALNSTGTVSILASSSISMQAATTLSLSGRLGLTFGSSYVYGFLTGSGTVSASTVSINAVAGTITSS